ncbi:hypothetical protein PybrP1_008860 [[Pythium] brassicae (nom. inval.)]|nr:hypothetical protein PybrP1_008860 [[Pythium] brassicae (nom. inval.)]
MLGDLPNLKNMLAKGKVDPNARDEACYTGKLACIQELLQAGASTQLVDQNGRNALHHACRKDQDDVVRFLVQVQKMDINAVSENKDTPLHKAVRGKGVKSIEVLLQNGANPHLCNDQNRTPLEELDSHPGTVTDVVQDEISTERVNEELEALRHDFVGDASHHHHAKARSKSLVSRFYGDSEARRADATLITEFSASIREFSEHQSSDRSLSRSRSSSSPNVAGGVWARVTGSGGGGGSASARNSARIGVSSTPVEFAPLDLAGLNAARNSAASPYTPSVSSSSCSTSTTPHTATQRGPSEPLSRPSHKSLKYAGKRVIMALRVKHLMPVDEKQEMIRRLLRKHMQRSDSKGVASNSSARAKNGDGEPTGGIESERGSSALARDHLSGLTLSITADG